MLNSSARYRSIYQIVQPMKNVASTWQCNQLVILTNLKVTGTRNLAFSFYLWKSLLNCLNQMITTPYLANLEDEVLLQM